ncbi:hypothetical protein BpHYR1_015755 [Brachionus plicatilis]|uniref:Uncharacterized protein n=1 Tax=Brachionus plicatilis TaxID=10195 RepID=A0A3M7PDL5_BRAPC|nr:hypothetical protein BpHYR1_015755 [Brachionus plicatilis]
MIEFNSKWWPQRSLRREIVRFCNQRHKLFYNRIYIVVWFYFSDTKSIILYLNQLIFYELMHHRKIQNLEKTLKPDFKLRVSAKVCFYS